MILSSKTLEKLRIIINEESERRSGPQLVSFFNDLGFSDTYQSGFPSRWVYTQDKLEKINGTPVLDQCIKKVFNPVNFVERFEDLQKLIDDFNLYLMFDGWKIFREGIQQRIDEIGKCLGGELALSAIFLSGSTLEGILLGLAQKYPKEFNSSSSSPKRNLKPLPLHEWTLENLINVAYELEFIDLDVKKFSHALKDFRNYIHPHQQMMSGFNPTIETARISAQVLKAAVSQIGKKCYTN